MTPSHGGLEVKAWTDNSLHSASVGLNPTWVWYIHRSEVETLVAIQNCRAPGAAMPLRYMPKRYLLTDIRPKISTSPRASRQGLASVWRLYHFQGVPTLGAIPKEGGY